MPEQGEQDRGLTSRVGPLEVDWPETIGYYGGVTLATALGFIELPVAIFIGALPFFKMLSHPRAPWGFRFVGQMLEEASRPVGGEPEATVRIPQDQNQSANNRRSTIFAEARLLADRAQQRKPDNAG